MPTPQEIVERAIHTSGVNIAFKGTPAKTGGKRLIEDLEVALIAVRPDGIHYNTQAILGLTQDQLDNAIRRL